MPPPLSWAALVMLGPLPSSAVWSAEGHLLPPDAGVVGRGRALLGLDEASPPFLSAPGPSSCFLFVPEGAWPFLLPGIPAPALILAHGVHGRRLGSRGEGLISSGWPELRYHF